MPVTTRRQSRELQSQSVEPETRRGGRETRSRKKSVRDCKTPQVAQASPETRSKRRSAKETSQVVPASATPGTPSRKRPMANVTNLKSPTPPKKAKRADPVKPEMKIRTPVASQGAGFVISQNPDGEMFKEINMVQAVRKCLEQNFFDFLQRLQLDFVPSHLYDLKAYLQSLKTAPIKKASNASVYMAKTYATEERHVQFIHHVKHSMCGQKEFPGASTILGILELILKISSLQSHKTIISTQQALVDLHSLFTTNLTIFPSQQLLSSYIEMLRLPFEVKGIRVESPKLGIFHAMLELLTDLLQPKEATTVKKRTSDSDQLYNFYYWDAQYEEKSSFEHFSREEKLERIFLVLDLLTHLFEENLTMFLTKYYKKLRSSLDDKERRPLICFAIWKDYETVTVINSTIKSIINIFVTTIALKFPKSRIKVMARLLNVVAHLLNLHEYPDNIKVYPCFNNITTNLVSAIKNAIDASPNYSVPLFIDVLENLRSPLLQLLLAHQALGNIDNMALPISLKVPIDIISKKAFAKHPKAQRPPTSPQEKFSTIEQDKALMKLVRIFSEAFGNFYCITSSLEELCKVSKGEDKPGTQLIVRLTDFTSLTTNLSEVYLYQKVKLRQVMPIVSKQINLKLSKETFSFYRREMKNLMILKRLMKKCNEHESSRFTEFSKVL